MTSPTVLSEDEPQDVHYSDPLIKAYLAHVGRVYDPKTSRRCPKCSTSGELVAVRWQTSGVMQLTCMLCRYEWLERAMDNIPYAERVWRNALSLLSFYSPMRQALTWGGHPPADEVERVARKRADQEVAVMITEDAFKRWISETYPDLMPEAARN